MRDWASCPLCAENSAALFTHDGAVNWDTGWGYRLHTGLSETTVYWSTALGELIGVLEHCMDFSGINMEHCMDFSGINMEHCMDLTSGF